ncbi:MAG: peptidylprolyl isomerase [Clostridia bacterium]|nr:peptidylprolyl isomerase [Clostridia bacterium]
MSKSKGKNSNYKNDIALGNTAVKSGISADTKKNIIIWSIVAVIIVGALIAGIVASIPRTYYVEMDFGEYGKIVLELNEEDAPITVNNFVKLVKKDFYNGLTIFRAQKGFVIQGGKDANESVPAIKGEFAENGVGNKISHVRGVISMARTGEPNSATSQLFITLDDSAAYSLDGKYAGFGHVVEGMEVVDAIAEALYGHAVDSMGFVDDADAIEIVSAKLIKYKAK